MHVHVDDNSQRCQTKWSPTVAKSRETLLAVSKILIGPPGEIYRLANNNNSVYS